MDLFGSDYEWSFGNPGTPELLGVGVVVLLLMAVFAYRTYRAKGRMFWLLPTGTRFLAVGFLALCIIQPSLKTTRTIVTRGRVVVLLDRSKSMSLPDMPEGITRHEKAKRLLHGSDAELLDELSDSFDVEFFEFAEDMRRVPPERPGAISPPEGPATLIADSLQRIPGRAGSAPLAGLILLSDGQDNSTGNVPEVARAIGAPVFTIGLGSRKEEAAKDLALADLKVEKTVLAGSTVVVELVIISKGITAVAPVTLTSAGKEITNGLASLKPGSKELVRLQFVPREPGKFIYSLATPARPEEITAENNHCSFSLEVIDRSFNILYVEGMMRWEYKFLRRALGQDQDVNLESYLRVGPNRFFHQPGRRAEADLPQAPGGGGEIPLTATGLENFNLVILGDIEAKYFTPAQQEAVAQFVSEKGGAFLMLGGKSSFAAGGYAGTPLEKILPVSLTPTGDLQSEGEFRPVLTPDGLTHPILRLDPDPTMNQKIWAGLPALAGSNRTGPAKPGAATLLIRRSAQRILAPDIILAVQRYGKGKTASLAIDTTWHWDFEALGRGGDSTAYLQFWSQMVRWLMPDQDTDPKAQRPIRVATDKSEYRQTDTVRVEVRVLQTEAISSAEAIVDGTLTSPNGAAAPIPLKKSETSGIYSTVLVPRATGPHQISVRLASGAATLGTDTTAFLVQEATQELEKTDLNEELLRSVAEMSGGEYHTPETCRQILSRIPEMKKETVKTEHVRLWNSPALLAAFITLATLEWLVRRYAVGD